MPKKNLLLRFALVVGLFLLAGCAQQAKTPTAPVAPQEPVMSVDSAIAEFVGQGLEGSSQSFPSSRYGYATVTIGRSYHSALNIPCKEAYIMGSTRTKAAVCKDASKGWILAPDILGDGAL